MVTTPTSGPQIQDFKVRNAIDQITTGLNAIEATELLSTGATAATNVKSTLFSSATTAQSLAASSQSILAVADAVVQVINALRTAKLMR